MNNHRKQYSDLLTIYLKQLQGDFESTTNFLLNSKPDLKNDSLFNIATWVWLLQKQVALQPDYKELLQIDYEIYVDYLSREWNEKHPRIWNDNVEDVFLSNIGMVYAALWETKHVRKHYSVQKTMTKIRDYVFDNLLTGGTVISGKENRNVSADQLLAVMPFGMFSPEDLIIVEAVQKMQHQLEMRHGLLPYQGADDRDVAAATAMIALYFLEKSDQQKAMYYADLTKNMERDKLAEVILEIYDYFASTNFDKIDQIIHDPLGNENVYAKQLTERVPHYPTIHEFLQLTCQVITEQTIQTVVVEIKNSDESWSIQETLEPVEKEERLFFEKKIPPLPQHGKYSYNFIAELKNGDRIVSETYHLTTLEIHKVERFKVITQTEEELLLAVCSEKDTHGLSIKFQDGNLQFNFIKELDINNKPLQIVGNVSIRSNDYSVNICLDQPKITITNSGRKILETHPLFAPIEWKVDADENLQAFTIHWSSPEDEEFYGFGERYNSLEQRGNVIDCFVYNQYRDQGTRTYMPIPFYLTNKEYACFIDTNMYTSFDLAKELKDKCSITIDQSPNEKETKIHYFFGTYKEQIHAYIQQTGKPKMIPVWALGPWMSSNNWDRESIVRNEIEMTNKLNIPATVIVLEQWSDETTYYMFNDAEYDLKDSAESYQYEEIHFPEWGRWPNPKKLVEYIHENNLKLLLWQIPIQKYLNKQSHPLKDQDEEYMIQKGYVVKNADGTPYRIPENWFTGSLLMDFSNEEGKKWWFSKRQYLIDIGVDGFKTDGGEFVFGKDLLFANGQKGSEMRNQYPNDYVKAYYEFAQQNEGMTFSRAGYTGAQNFPAHWAGDERSTFAAFKRSLIAGLNAGLSGVVFWGWDLAGFNGDIPTAELYMRSTAMAAFCPIMQYHAESKGEFNQDRTPWNIAERTGHDEVIDVYRFFANVRMNLIPYIYSQSVKSSTTGLPLMRALMIEYPEDQRVYGIYDEYLFGDDLLVAPIIEEGALTRKVYLPEGTWFNLWTKEKIQGPAFIEVPALFSEIPVFVKGNRALLFNLDQTKQLGSSVGNDVTTYDTPVCKIFYHEDFEQTIFDHLGNEVKLSVKKIKDTLQITSESSFKQLEIKVFGTDDDIVIEHV